MSLLESTLHLDWELIVDCFAGGGGLSIAVQMALGREVDIAINHDKFALGMHRINHPRTRHYCEDVYDIEPIEVTRGRRVGFAWFSPDCKHFSKAKGGKPLSKKIRGLVLIILKWISQCRPRVIGMENVEEITTWGPLLKNGRPDPAHKGRTWKAFLSILGSGIDPTHPDLPYILRTLKGSVTNEQCVRGFGYQFEGREIRACTAGTRTIRKRFYMIARCDGQPIVWPAPTHFPPDDVPPGRKPYQPIADCIDWNDRGHSIFLTRRQARKVGCRRPLACSTKRRIAVGVERYVLKAAKLFLVSLTHHGADRVEPIDEPIKTITGAHRGEKALVNVRLAPFLTEHANASKQRNFPANESMRTLCAEVKGGHFALVGASLVKLRGDAATHSRGQSLSDPGHSITAGGTHLGLMSACMVAYYGSEKDGQAMDESCRCVTTKPRFGLAVTDLAEMPLTPQQLAGARRVAKFLRKHGVEFEGEFARVGDFIIYDIELRMLTPRELYRAQGFPENYIIDRALIPGRGGKLHEVELTKEQQIRMCGNAVCPPMGAAIVAVNVPELAVWTNGKRKKFLRRLAVLQNN